MYRKQSGVLMTDVGNRQQGLAVSKLSTNLNELGDKKTLNRRYAEFIYRRYMQLTDSASDALDLLNQTWQPESSLSAFDEITFSEKRPKNLAEFY